MRLQPQIDRAFAEPTPQLPGVPFRIMAATKKDGFRKPMPGMWHALEDVYRAQGVEIGLLHIALSQPTSAHNALDKSSSFFVGDAAARKNDFSGSDRKWALNVDIPFLTPEVSSFILAIY